MLIFQVRDWLKLTPCSLILSDSHLSSFRYSLLDAKQARSITKANGVAFSNIDNACIKKQND